MERGAQLVWLEITNWLRANDRSVILAAAMALLPETRALFVFLRNNPAIRSRIAAPHDATILYAGNILKPAWREVAEMKRRLPQLASRKTLPDVLQQIALVGQPHPNLLQWAQSIDVLTPWRNNGWLAWRALSGIFASNARGAVSFVIGSGVTRADKVFAATEVSVLARNPHIDGTTRDLLAYYQRCIASGDPQLSVSFIPA